MADFLASFNFNGPAAAPPEEPRCMGIEDVRARLSEVLEGKVSPTRAEHVDATIEIAQAAQFTVPQEQHDATDSTTLSTEAVAASHVLANQPQADPNLQTAVSKQLVAAIGEVDGSTWSVRDVTRQTQGWVFTYECNHSWQHWSRRGKSIKNLSIAEFSLKEPDTTSGARPAFDCRGFLTISFLRRNKAITVSYTHTPIHKTVSETYEYFKPAPPPAPPASEPTEPTPAKKPRKSDGSRKKKPAVNGAGEDGAPKEKKKRRKSTKAGTISNAELVLDGAPLQEGQNLASVAQSAHNMSTGTETGGAADNSQATPINTTFNISPEEAARRHATAMAKLQEAGVDPASLSAQQFSIFSNQSPEVQKESLKMLVTYGAEKLRIVQPANKESPATSNTATPYRAGHEDATAQQMNGQNGNQNTTDGEATSSKCEKKARKLGKSRLSCFNCKSSRTKKCSKERPSCDTCVADGVTCEYPPQKPRSRKSAADAGEDVDAEGETTIAEDTTYHEADDLSDYPAAPIAHLLTANAEDTNGHDAPAYGNPLSPLAMPLPRADSPQMFQMHPSGQGPAGLALGQERTHYQPYISPKAVSVSPYNTTTYPEPSTGNTQAMEANISPHLTMQNNMTNSKSPKKRSHKAQASSTDAQQSHVKAHKNKPSDRGSLQLPSLGGNSSSPTLGHYNTSNDTSPRIAYEPYSYNKRQSSASTHSRVPDRRQPSMAHQSSDRPPAGGRATPGLGGNTLSAKQNSSYMRQNTSQGLQSQMALPSPSHRTKGSQNTATTGQQHASYGSYSYTNTNRPNQGWYGSNANDQGSGQQNPSYSWGMPQQSWPRMQ